MPQTEEQLSLLAGLERLRFAESAAEFVDCHPLGDHPRWMFQLLTKISIRNPAFGVHGPMTLVLITSKHRSLSEVTEAVLTEHSKLLPSVCCRNDLIVIGAADGKVHVFSKWKTQMVQELFSTRIDAVSIGPKEGHIAAISYGSLECKVFPVSKNGGQNHRAVQTLKLVADDIRYFIAWKSPSECVLNVRHVGT
jgi:hypothetical protein